MKYIKILLPAILFVTALSVVAQKDDEKKYLKWNRDEARRMMENSNWAKTYQSTSGSANSSSQQAAREMGQSVRSGGSNPQSVARDFGPAPVVVRLHSGLPIRQAIVRIKQIDAKYDKMNDEQKAEFDKGAKGFLDCAICKNYYVVTLTKFPVAASSSGIDEAIFQRFKLENVKGKIRLENDKGEKRELIQFTPPAGPGEPAVMFFQRFDENKKPLLTPENKEVKLVFDNNFLDLGNPYGYLLPRTFDFKVSKLVVGDTVDF